MSNLDAMLDQAFLAYNQKDYDSAEDLARQVLTLAPAHGDGLYLLGLVASQMGAYEPAEKLLYQAVQLYPENKQYKLSLGFVLEKQGRLDEALSFYEPYKADAFVLSEIGFIYLQKGQLDFAKSAFDKSLSLNEDVLTAYIGKSLILRRQNLIQESLNILEEALTHGQSAELYYQLAQAYRHVGKLKSALNAIAKALKIEEVASFYNEKGLIEEAQGLFENAKNSYEMAIEKNAYSADGYANLANIYFKEKDLKKAEDLYKRALGIDKDFLNAHHNLALVLYEQNRLTEALEHLRSVIILNPNHTSGLYNLAIILEETGDYSESAGLYFNLLAQHKEIADLEFRIQNVLTLLAKGEKKDKKQALSFAKGWVKSFPESVVAEYTNASLNGQKVTDALSKAYAEALYDAFAPSYELEMKKLQSTVLEKMGEILTNNDTKDVLDLGCGTGSLSSHLTTFNTLTGVDISQKMLLKAQEKEVYTRLVHQDIIGFLKEEKKQYDWVVASDVTGYFSNIELFLSLVLERLSPNGSFLFTIELGEGAEDITLLENARFVYKEEFVSNLLLKMGYDIQVKNEIPLRKEGLGIAKGILYLVQKKCVD